MVLTPIARIVLRKLWSTGVDKSTAPIRESLAQKSLAKAAEDKAIAPANNAQPKLAARAAMDPVFRTARSPNVLVASKAHLAPPNQPGAALRLLILSRRSIDLTAG
jgi:hypothetical protein